MIQNELNNYISKWKERDRGGRIKMVWQTINTVGAFALPLLLLFAFLFALPSIPSNSTLLILIGIGILWGCSVTLSEPIAEYFDI